ncbi:GNAT family N-acetyltransferase [Paenibacillus sp. DCT19]|uniref:GNAT family N-acetyltransferase n=1 Tax=Paenibacillus sp. DCT19 TaxID=2211212 RepID=UPI000FE1AA0D|nr:GNAT family N-acetyltransferase [Paenibacillus sp. DCT19]
MITELQRQDFHKVQHIIDTHSTLEVRAVLFGFNPGRIYVDDISDIKAALVWIQGQSGFQLIGDPQSESFAKELSAFMTTDIEPELVDLTLDSVEIGVQDGRWEGILRNMAGKRELSSDNQHVYRFHSPQGTERVGGIEETAADVYQLDGKAVQFVRVDSALIHDLKFANSSFLEDKITYFWSTVDDFLQHGFGYMLVHEQNNEIMSICLSGFVAGQTHAIDIETVEAYRNRGYAAVVAKAFVEACRREGLQPYWDCSPDNTGSVRLAERVGMVFDFDYSVYWYPLSS